MQEDLRDYILADAAVVAALGARLYWSVRPQGDAVPAARLTRVSAAPSYAMSGDVGLTQSRVQVDCFAQTYAAAAALSRAIVARLTGAAATQGDTVFQGAFVESERDRFEGDPNAAERLHMISVDLMIWHS